MGMTDELMDLVSGSGGLGAIGGLLGGDDNAAKGAMGAAVPALLGAAGKRAGSPAGASALFDLVGQADDGILGNIGGLLGGGDSDGVGAGLLGSLLGGRQEAVTQGVAKQSGIGAGAIAKFLPMLAPMVMGFLKKKVMGGGMDAAGLASSLGDERKSMESSGLGGILGLLDGGDDEADNAGFLDGAKKLASMGGIGALGGMAAKATGVGESARGAVSGAADRATSVAPAKPGMPKWLLPLLALAALALILFFVFKGGDDDDGVSERDQIIAELVDDSESTFTNSEAGCLYDEVGTAAREYLNETPSADADVDALLAAADVCGVS